MTMMGLVTNKQGLLACRFILGLAEAGLFPGVNVSFSLRDRFIHFFQQTDFGSIADNALVLLVLLVQAI